VVLAIMADKRVIEFLNAFGSEVSEWHIGEVDNERCLSVSSLEKSLKTLFKDVCVCTYDSVENAYLGACAKTNSSPNSVVVVTGSFFNSIGSTKFECFFRWAGIIYVLRDKSSEKHEAEINRRLGSLSYSQHHDDLDFRWGRGLQLYCCD